VRPSYCAALRLPWSLWGGFRSIDKCDFRSFAIDGLGAGQLHVCRCSRLIPADFGFPSEVSLHRVKHMHRDQRCAGVVKMQAGSGTLGVSARARSMSDPMASRFARLARLGQPCIVDRKVRVHPGARAKAIE
jgi:hypothetical protein